MGCCKKKALAEGAKVAVKAGKCGRAAHGHHHFHRCRKLIVAASIGLVAAAIIEELKKHPEERNWHGFIGGLVPYDFRVPTPEKVVNNLWNPEGPVVSPKTFGVGWDPNIGRIVMEAVALPDIIEGHYHDDYDDDGVDTEAHDVYEEKL
ncbi:MAG: hypothetical protein FWG25_08390 [Promicromonosporaceae bacterium]|nr:hypothetical protein [Promicromonosporaceae bacterium]